MYLYLYIYIFLHPYEGRCLRHAAAKAGADPKDGIGYVCVCVYYSIYIYMY